ncbi:hypothetical protein [Roseibium album]|uniref:hypothetical protein n=1 Tax=Roseibium album TaxID=311410 RepID=UPI00329767B5
MTTPMKPPGGLPPETPQSELAWTQGLISLDLPAAVGEEVMKLKYPTSFSAPPVNHDFIRGVATHDDAEKLVTGKAETDHTSENPLDVDGRTERSVLLGNEIEANETEAKQAKEAQQGEPTFEEVAVKEAKYENANFSFAYAIMNWLLVLAGIGVMGATLSNFILESDKVPLAYDYPAIVYVFAFVPVTIMFILAQMWQWLTSDHGKKTYTLVLFILNLVICVGWIITFGPAYSGGDNSLDLAAEPGFDFYPLHITLQLCAEILSGALIKIALFHMERDYRKTEPRETIASKKNRATTRLVELKNAPLRQETDAIAAQLVAYEAAKASYVADCLAALRTEQANIALLDERANAAAVQARVAMKQEHSPSTPLN